MDFKHEFLTWSITQASLYETLYEGNHKTVTEDHDGSLGSIAPALFKPRRNLGKERSTHDLRNEGSAQHSQNELSAQDSRNERSALGRGSHHEKVPQMGKDVQCTPYLIFQYAILLRATREPASKSIGTVRGLVVEC